jgi:hypothetical protein
VVPLAATATWIRVLDSGELGVEAVDVAEQLFGQPLCVRCGPDWWDGCCVADPAARTADRRRGSPPGVRAHRVACTPAHRLGAQAAQVVVAVGEQPQDSAVILMGDDA